MHPIPFAKKKTFLLFSHSVLCSKMLFFLNITSFSMNVCIFIRYYVCIPPRAYIKLYQRISHDTKNSYRKLYYCQQRSHHTPSNPLLLLQVSTACLHNTMYTSCGFFLPHHRRQHQRRHPSSHFVFLVIMWHSIHSSSHINLQRFHNLKWPFSAMWHVPNSRIYTFSESPSCVSFTRFLYEHQWNNFESVG